MQIINRSNNTPFGCSTCRSRVFNFAKEHNLSQGTTKAINVQLENYTSLGGFKTNDGQVVVGHFPIADYFFNRLEKELDAIKASTPHKVEKTG